MSPFEVIGSLSVSEDDRWEEVGEKDYNSFMINRGFSYYLDCIMQANEMNRFYSAPKQLQYDFFRYSIQPKKKRFSKWSSQKKDAEVQQVSEYYQLSLRKAATVRAFLTEEDMASISAKLNKGGTK
jgi:hypothetical protein